MIRFAAISAVAAIGVVTLVQIAVAESGMALAVEPSLPPAPSIKSGLLLEARLP